MNDKTNEAAKMDAGAAVAAEMVEAVEAPEVIRGIVSCAGVDFSIEPGVEKRVPADLSAAAALDLIRAGYAEAVETATDAVVPETATIAPAPQTAAKTTATETAAKAK